MTLLIEPFDSGVRFATSEWVCSGELYRAVRAFNILREVIGGGFHGVEIYASRGAYAVETGSERGDICFRWLLHEPRRLFVK